MLYIVWIWWLFRSEEVAAILPLTIELCLACRLTAALLWYWMHFCCEAKAPQCLSTRCVLPSLLPCMCTCFQEELSQGQCLRCFAGLFHTPMYSLGRLIWPALPQLCCQVWVSCVWSLGQREELLHFRRGDSPSKPASQASCLPCPESAARKWKYNPISYRRGFLYWRVETEGC